MEFFLCTYIFLSLNLDLKKIMLQNKRVEFVELIHQFLLLVCYSFQDLRKIPKVNSLISFLYYTYIISTYIYEIKRNALRSYYLCHICVYTYVRTYKMLRSVFCPLPVGNLRLRIISHLFNTISQV